ncbi:MAG: alpha/beta hydrolase [Polyangiales bacterium]
MLNRLQSMSLPSLQLLAAVILGASGCASDTEGEILRDAPNQAGEPAAQLSPAESDERSICTTEQTKPTSVPFTSIPGYQRMTKAPSTGPLEPTLEAHPGLPEWTVYRPKELGDRKHPIVIWGNGGCLKNGTLYGQFLLELASHGFIAVSDGKPLPANADPAAGGIRGFGGGGGAPMIQTLDWLVAENARPCSPLYGKLDLEKVAVSGQSCGGMMSLSAAGDKRITTALINNSGLFQRDAKVYAALHTPIAYLIGGAGDLAYANAEADYAAITNVPVFNANNPAGHAATWDQPNGGEFGRVGLGWLKWQLMGDETAAKMFKGADCELCKPGSKWTVKKKKID